MITAHDHNYERFAPQDPLAQADATGIRVFVVGTGGAALRPIGTIRANSEVRNATTYGVLKLTLGASSYNWEFIPVAGQTFRDTGSQACFTGGPVPDGTRATLNVTDGWDSKNLKTLVADGKLPYVTRSDNAWLEVGSGQFLALQFGALRANGSIQQAELAVEHHEEASFDPRGVVLQTGGGALTAPFVARDLAPSTSSSDQVLNWDVTAWARDASRVNDLKLVVRNDDPAGKKIRIDQVVLKVTYGPAPAPSTAPVEVRLYATDGWDEKNQKTLLGDGKLYLAQVSDNLRSDVEADYFLSYAFQGIPSSAQVREARVHVEHHEEPGITAAPAPVFWEVSTGDLRNPDVPLATFSPPILAGESSEATVAWNVSAVVDQVSLVNDLKLVVRNEAANFKKTRNDRAYVVVKYVDAP